MLQIKRVIFTGNFLRRNMIALQTVSYSLAKWSELAVASQRQPRPAATAAASSTGSASGSGSTASGSGVMEALFLKHEGYFGALGAFLANRVNVAGTQGL